MESYFGAFEYIAIALYWVIDEWEILLKLKLAGRAREACHSPSTENGLIYDKVKGYMGWCMKHADSILGASERRQARHTVR